MKAIYEIRNNNNGKIYVGSAQNVEKRWRNHKWALNRGTHNNPYLQNAWNKHGEENFTFLVLEEVEKDRLLLPCEQRWLDETKCYDREVGYNALPTAGSPLGRKHSAETKRKISNALKGKKPTEETRRKISKSLKGRKLAEEKKEQLRALWSGERAPRAKLTWEKVREMRGIYELGGTTTKELSELFGVSQKSAWNVVNGKTWKNDPEQLFR